MDITELELQHRFTFDDGSYADGDIYSPELDYLFECDGRMKYELQSQICLVNKESAL